jgi:hypothetical protein
MRKVSDKSSTENQNTRFRFSNFFFGKACGLWGNVEKYCTAGQAIEKNMVHTHCMLDTYGHKHTLRICYTYCFPMETIVTRPAPQRYVTRTLPVSFFNFGWRSAGKNLSLRCCHIQILRHSYVHIHKRVACLGSEPRYSATGQTFVSMLAWELDI